jgi:hypothetical protein
LIGDVNHEQSDRSAEIRDGAHDGLGEYVVKCLTEDLLSDPGMREETRKRLRPCLKHVSATVERACPAVMGMGDEGFFGGYGVWCPSGGTVLIAVNSKKGIGITLENVEHFEPRKSR